MTKVKRLCVGEDTEQLELLCAANGNINCTNALEIIGQFVKNLNLHLPYDLVVLIDAYLGEMKMYVYKKDICSQKLHPL